MSPHWREHSITDVGKILQQLHSTNPACSDERYLAHLEDAFLLTCVDIASNSERRRQVNPRKIYPVDTGLIASFDGSGGPMPVCT